MLYLLDTGILLRLRTPADPNYGDIRSALRALRSQDHGFVTTAQNIGEFWNVATRPVTARGGYGLTPHLAESRLKLIERIVTILPDTPAVYPIWRKLVVSRSVLGVQVHDARIVAMMQVHAVPHLFTLNPQDFKRFPEVSVVTPTQVLAAP